MRGIEQHTQSATTHLHRLEEQQHVEVAGYGRPLTEQLTRTLRSQVRKQSGKGDVAGLVHAEQGSSKLPQSLNAEARLSGGEGMGEGEGGRGENRLWVSIDIVRSQYTQSIVDLYVIHSMYEVP